MFEKVNPGHPDKLADRIAGALVDLAYKAQKEPKIAVEVLLGHGECHIVAESSVVMNVREVWSAVDRIVGHHVYTDYREVPQDVRLRENQAGGIRCGDNGIFRGAPVTDEQKRLAGIAREIYSEYPFDGKYILDGRKMVICQSRAETHILQKKFPDAVVNPLGDWTGGIDVDTGAVNRKLGSDMGNGVTGGGLHGKDLSKADVSVNIWAFLRAQRQGEPIEVSCAIGDDDIMGNPYAEIVAEAKEYIDNIGGFEAFAEWGLIR